MKRAPKPPALVVGVQSPKRRPARRLGLPDAPEASGARLRPREGAVRSALSMLDETSTPGRRARPGIEVSSYEASAPARPRSETLEEEEENGEGASTPPPGSHDVPPSWEEVGVPGAVEADDDELAALWLLEAPPDVANVPSADPAALGNVRVAAHETSAAMSSGSRNAPGARRHVARAALGAVAVTVLALGVGAATSTWIAGKPLLVGSARLVQLDALRQAGRFQAALGASARAVDANPGSLPSVEAQDAAMQSLAAEIQAWSPPPSVAVAVRPLEREVTAAQTVDGYVEDGDRSGVMPATRLRAAETSFATAYREAEQVLGRLGAAAF